jgi:hypothetical protein
VEFCQPPKQFPDTSGFQDAAGTVYASTFTTANLASHEAGTNNWSYFTSSATGFYINGFGTDTGIFIVQPKQLYVPVPFTYGNTRNDVSRVQVDTVVSGLTARIILNFNCTFDADGYGSLTTPVAYLQQYVAHQRNDS